MSRSPLAPLFLSLGAWQCPCGGSNDWWGPHCLTHCGNPVADGDPQMHALMQSCTSAGPEVTGISVWWLSCFAQDQVTIIFIKYETSLKNYNICFHKFEFEATGGALPNDLHPHLKSVPSLKILVWNNHLINHVLDICVFDSWFDSHFSVSQSFKLHYTYLCCRLIITPSFSSSWKWHIFYQFVCLFRYESFIFNAIFMKMEPGGEKKVICQAGELGQSSIW